MLIFLPTMLYSSAQIFDLLCSCKRFVLKNLHHKNFNVATVLLEIMVDVLLIFNHIFSQALPIMLALCLMLLATYYAQNYAGIIG